MPYGYTGARVKRSDLDLEDLAQPAPFEPEQQVQFPQQAPRQQPAARPPVAMPPPPPPPTPTQRPGAVPVAQVQAQPAEADPWGALYQEYPDVQIGGKKTPADALRDPREYGTAPPAAGEAAPQPAPDAPSSEWDVWFQEQMDAAKAEIEAYGQRALLQLGNWAAAHGLVGSSLEGQQIRNLEAQLSRMSAEAQQNILRDMDDRQRADRRLSNEEYAVFSTNLRWAIEHISREGLGPEWVEFYLDAMVPGWRDNPEMHEAFQRWREGNGDDEKPPPGPTGPTIAGHPADPSILGTHIDWRGLMGMPTGDEEPEFMDDWTEFPDPEAARRDWNY